MYRYATPVLLTLAVGLLSLFIAVAAILAALQTPQLGLRLAIPEQRAAQAPGLLIERDWLTEGALFEGSRLRAISATDRGTVALGPQTLVEEPDTLADFAAISLFREEQQTLWHILHAPRVVLHLVLPDGHELRRSLRPEPGRDLATLPPVFWVQILSGLLGLGLGGWVWALHPTRMPQLMLLTMGIGLQMAATSAAIYSTRELALPETAWVWLSGANQLGALILGAGILGLFLCYPRRIAPRWMTLVLLGAIPFWTLANHAGLMPSNAIGYQLPTVTIAAATLLCALLQIRATRDDLPARAALWIVGISTGIGAGGFVLTRSLPGLLGLPEAMSQGYAFALLGVLYLGLALSVLRFRLFDVERFAYHTLFYISGAVLLLAVDATLILLLSLDRLPALGLSLFLVAVIYLPLRDAAGQALRSRRRRSQPISALVRAADEVAFARDDSCRRRRWENLLAREFGPLAIDPLPFPGPEMPLLDEEGIALLVPAVPPLPAYRLRWRDDGRRLFSGADLGRAEEVCTILGQLLEGRRAYRAGATEERARIARDIHDNISVHLLGALHSDRPERKNELVRETLADLRRIIEDGDDTPEQDLAEILAELRHDLAELLAANGIALDWPAAPGPAIRLPNPLAHALRSLLREAVNNARRHAGCHLVRVRIGTDDARILVSVADDGSGLPPAVATQFAITGTGPEGWGHGLGNMRSRVEKLGGEMQIGVSPEGGVLIEASLPCEAAGHPAGTQPLHRTPRTRAAE
ncbi:sensor histidine kinase [Oceanicola sp. S124]|uniref:sensor histidine kinase n=1 Tax=Oceanicola sp. S124 TaxID=1042378 RepID=UPI0002559020|nr:ATP-binding protein [Oceanicola sp. S124]